MKKISIGFSYYKGFSPLSSLIKLYMQRSFSHTYIKINLSDFNESSVFHAISKGIIIVSYNNFINKNVVIKEFELNISDELYKELCEDFHASAGKNYGFIQNIGIFISDKFNLQKNPINDGINCSEWVAYCLEEIDPKTWDSSKKDFNLIKPSEIYDYLDNNI